MNFELKPPRLFSAVLAALAITVLIVAPARAEITVDITQGNVEPLPIAVPDFVANGEAARRFSADIAGVVAADLERSGLFKPIDKRAFIAQPDGLAVTPRFNNWKPLNGSSTDSVHIGISYLNIT